MDVMGKEVAMTYFKVLSERPGMMTELLKVLRIDSLWVEFPSRTS
jgi:hypothetical protein